MQCQLVPQPAGHVALKFLRHTLDFWVTLFHQGRAAEVNEGKVFFFYLLIYCLFPLSSQRYTLFFGVLFDSHWLNLRMTQTHHPCSICVSFNGRVWLLRVGKALRNAQMINTKKTEQK